MRLALFAFVLAGCMEPASDPYPGPIPPDPTFGCQSDNQCGSAVCARDGSCVSPTEIYVAHVSWTLQGMAADPTTCTNSPELELWFEASGANGFGFSPVPCAEGKFTIDKLPTWFTRVELSRDGDRGTGAYGTIDRTTGNVALDLQY